MNTGLGFARAVMDPQVGLAIAVMLAFGWLAFAGQQHAPASAEPSVFEKLLERVTALRRPGAAARYHPPRSARLRVRRLHEVREQVRAEREFIRGRQPQT